MLISNCLRNDVPSGSSRAEAFVPQRFQILPSRTPLERCHQPRTTGPSHPCKTLSKFTTARRGAKASSRLIVRIPIALHMPHIPPPTKVRSRLDLDLSAPNMLAICPRYLQPLHVISIDALLLATIPALWPPKLVFHISYAACFTSA